MRSRRVLLVLVFCLGFDTALPYEPSARGGFELEDEQDEDALRVGRRRAERPEAVRERRPPALPTVVAPRAVAVARATRVAAEAAPPEAAPRARTQAPDPASPSEDH